MSEPMEQKISQAMADLAAMQDAVAQAESELSQATATARSRDRAVEVTVGPQGELTGLKFPDGKHQSMTGPQLAASILEAAQDGRAQMARKVMETFAPLTQGSGGVEGLGVDIDWERMFGSALGGGSGSGMGRSAGDRLRDEIHEDTDDTLPRGR
ncbi:DNA-binding protein YbaB [Streptomyces sp. LBL]|uniref:YbaB/EbfC family nucleoid-associated protein n=1 Tax=Streptomyces sp. LBL TaxID=2940562 RepID=UPI002474605D|nr:YbaB/EbfC family nucleoid-associated protein [Streptomyces sp. LBL]MDH6624501.1 DNA-binding protein YbaB [Streptomyces sp. LBL]